MKELDISTLVVTAAELREQLQGRLPERIQWGWKDFLVGTAGMSLLQLGAYVRLLHVQLDKGCINRDTLEAVRKEFVEFGEGSVTVLAKFNAHDGDYYNVRMLQEFIAAARAAIGNRKRASGGKSSITKETF